MASQRRVKVLLIGVLAVVFVILYYTGDATRIQNQQFYQSTVEAMDARAAAKKSASDDSGLFQKLQPNRAPADAELVRSNREKLGYESKDDNQDTEEVSIAGRTKMQKPKANKSESENKEAQEKAEVEAELNAVLKRSPIIIFSKSYCPFSAKAKSILLDKYSVVPAPFVVELDQHPLGPKLQALLAKNTGRSTVPNILVNGRSIGGGDDIAALDRDRTLASTLKSLGGKRIMEAAPKAQKEV
ncbi:hypothetical protein VTN00DRAFT_4508 [Thermoascus crustaceus]|uniref:uncharacterized protein n=1 Tax=Thermoascus crustaceus TaxID=5088 RepID=UPI0037435EBF